MHEAWFLVSSHPAIKDGRIINGVLSHLLRILLSWGGIVMNEKVSSF
jgi:hypothetical protein